MHEALTFRVRNPKNTGPTTFLYTLNNRLIDYHNIRRLHTRLNPPPREIPDEDTLCPYDVIFVLNGFHLILRPGLASQDWLWNQVEHYVLPDLITCIPTLPSPTV